MAAGKGIPDQPASPKRTGIFKSQRRAARASAAGQSTLETILGRCVILLDRQCLCARSPSIHNTGTDASRSTVTDQTGDYNLPNVEPGKYEVTFEAAGFPASSGSGGASFRGQTARIDRHLLVSTQNETVNVEATAAVINSEDQAKARTGGPAGGHRDAGHGFDQPVVGIYCAAGPLVDGHGSECGPFGDGVRH
jgi:hypothetical protein